MTAVAELDLDGITPAQVEQVTARLLSRDFDQWASEAARVGHCHRPVKLVGQAHTIDKATGSVLSTLDSNRMPDGVLYVKCGNRRALVCPPCSREYGADMWHLLRAGAAGGDKGVPTSVATHPMVFATFTAPSFGPVHAIKQPGSKGSRRCRPRTRGETCPHGKSLSCMAIHPDSDPRVGQPMCSSCYDYESHVTWQWWAPELWRRLTIELPRTIAHALHLTQKAARTIVRVSFAKVGEYQQRGVIHFHAIIRLDGPPEDNEPFPAPLLELDSRWLADQVTAAARKVEYTAPLAYRDGADYRLAFGDQIDARPIHRRAGRDDLDGPINPETVAAYIAKYSTKSAADLDPADRADTKEHLARIRAMELRLADGADELYPPGGPFDNPYRLLGKRSHMLGFRGHFASKSRRYSTTLTRIRGARRRYQRARASNPNGVVDVAALDQDLDTEETTLVIGSWRFAGTGWATDGDAAMAMQPQLEPASTPTRSDLPEKEQRKRGRSNDEEVVHRERGCRDAWLRRVEGLDARHPTGPEVLEGRRVATHPARVCRRVHRAPSCRG